MKKRFLALALAIMLLAGLLLSGCSIAISAQDARKGVVRVVTFYTRYYYDYEKYMANEAELITYTTVYSSGSAFGVGKTGQPTDIFVTNRHVVDDEQDLYGPVSIKYNGENRSAVYFDKRTSIYILKDDYAITSSGGLDTSRASMCTILYAADSGDADVAVLQCADTLEDRMALPLLDKNYELEVGDEVIALGYPGTSDDDANEINTLASVDHVTVTEGKISVFRPVTPEEGSVAVDTIQHSATINHGNSGGPLITTTGEVAGINTYSVSGSSGDTSTNNSIEIKYVMNVLDDLNIDYDVRKPGSEKIIYVGAAAAAVLIVAVIVILLKHKKPPVDPDTGGSSGSNNNGGSSGNVIPDDTGLRIQGISGVYANRRFALGRQMRIGRDGSCNDLIYPEGTPGVSRRHCLLTYQDGKLYLQDLGSSNGTFLGNGQRLSVNQPVVLRIGDRFSLGSQAETFVVTGRGGI